MTKLSLRQSQLVAGLLALTALVTVGSTVAQASANPTERLILAHTLPGFRLVVPGPLNGPVTVSSMSELGLNDPGMLRSVADGQLTGYIRLWGGLGVNQGTAIIDILFRLPSATDANVVMDGFLGSLSGVATPIRGIPDAYHETVTHAHGLAFRYHVGAFAVARGSYVVFLVMTDHGRLSQSIQRSLFLSQYRRLPPSAVVSFAPPQTNSGLRKAGEISGFVLLGVLVVGLIAVARSRRRRREMVSPSATGGGQVAPTQLGSSLMASAMSPQPATAPSAPRTPERVFCSWCGVERDPTSHAIHHCGSRRRPAVYCSGCGSELQPDAAFCRDCGTPVANLSPA